MKLQIAIIALIFSGNAYCDPDCSDFGEKDRGVNSRTAICESAAVSDEYFLVKNELLSILKSYGASVNGKPHWHEELSAVAESVENYEKLVEQFADQSCFLISTGNGQNMSGVNTLLCTLEYKRQALLVLKQLLKTCKDNPPAEGRNVCEY